MYYVLACKDPLDHDLASISYDPDDPWRSWVSGARFSDPPPPDEPVIAYVEKGDSGEMPELDDVALPLMSQRLARVLTQAGVDNIDFYPAEVEDLASGTVYKDHVAFNLIGPIAAADVAKTRFSETNRDRMISADIDSLTIDESKTRGALMFRLAESVTTIVVHESVKRAIEAAGIDTLDFIEPDDWVS